ncbi:KpsF/GutQ family sugar-phosphate isomerase [Maribius pontilimi]|uniref:KpsF/GutQ family sugar-phosphate isomerase n=1 Tax=Palleronia pontilimi TaxID=1964209 RepID=A0A934IJ95_9RHOB|nr:KpsF/GutQ family sugar-phosphate isomerase [Palleronia pontilimi]MBJ3764350.1 KpsF/GutQ family sugar-phosphate isomerase [Palleronia pontilimi]
MSGSTGSTPLDAARRVLMTEAAALGGLADAMPSDFSAAVAAIRAAPGHVIVSGIGKSGHVGNKVAATLASTGTPAHFVHPAEASHGDLGMIGANDICLMISNSGETTELGDILTYCTRFSIPIIGISKRPDSTLMRAATYRLTLPDAPEACPMGLAPTTSTTLTLALGDALAVALMEDRGFAAENFAVFHPGGKLGAQLMRVRQLMHGPDDLPLVGADTAMGETLVTMTARGFGIAGVVDGQGRLAGVVTDGDLRRHMEGLMQARAGDVATRNPVTVSADMLAAQALAVLNERKVSALMVVDGDGRPEGVLHIHDLLRAGVV